MSVLGCPTNRVRCKSSNTGSKGPGVDLGATGFPESPATVTRWLRRVQPDGNAGPGHRQTRGSSHSSCSAPPSPQKVKVKVWQPSRHCRSELADVASWPGAAAAPAPGSSRGPTTHGDSDGRGGVAHGAHARRRHAHPRGHFRSAEGRAVPGRCSLTGLVTRAGAHERPRRRGFAGCPESRRCAGRGSGDESRPRFSRCLRSVHKAVRTGSSKTQGGGRYQGAERDRAGAEVGRPGLGVSRLESAGFLPALP